jgi:hypothetical protein
MILAILRLGSGIICGGPGSGLLRYVRGAHAAPALRAARALLDW